VAAFERLHSRKALMKPYRFHCVRKRKSKMPKMKTKSSAKKRFKLTATGKVKTGQAGKRHGMIKRSNSFIRSARGTTLLSEPDARIVKKFMPNG